MEPSLVYLLGEVQELRKRLEVLEHEMQHVKRPAISNGRSNTERVVEVLRSRPGASLTASEIARLARMEPGSARMVLYADRDTFLPERISAGRVKWRLNPRRGISEVPEEVMNMEPAPCGID